MINTVKAVSSGYLVDDIKFIPVDEDNIDYQAVLAWLSHGSTPEPEFTQEEIDDAAKVKVVSMRQARLALLQHGALDGVNLAIEALDEPERSVARIEWNSATEVDRSNVFTIMLSAIIGLTPEQEDELFNLASTL